MAKKTKITMKQGLQATKFIAERLEDSRRYDLLNKDSEAVKLRNKKDLVEDQSTIEIFIANALSNVNDVKDRHRTNARNHIYTVPIFYKDGITSFVRLFDVDSSWMHHRTLKRYSQQQKHGILKLRKKEELIMQYFGKVLSYYQPQTERLPESVRDIRMLPVTFDYSHIDMDNKAYRHAIDGTVSKTFKLPNEITRITNDSNLVVGKVDHFWKAHLNELKIPYRENKKGQLFLF